MRNLFLEMQQNQIVNLNHKIGTHGRYLNVRDLVEVDIGFIQEHVKMNHVRDQKSGKQVTCAIHMIVT